jgi:hypothetical protein
MRVENNRVLAAGPAGPAAGSYVSTPRPDS